MAQVDQPVWNLMSEEMGGVFPPKHEMIQRSGTKDTFFFEVHGPLMLGNIVSLVFQFAYTVDRSKYLAHYYHLKYKGLLRLALA